jgi:ubiquinone/menaquinone biosynthesis C-methylase UbiE
MNRFDTHARTWDTDPMHIERSEAIAKEMIRILPTGKKLHALEYGAGTGILSFILRDRFSDIVLMDSSKEMINVCREKTEYFKTNHIHPIWIDLENTEYPGKFDIIYNQMVMHHVKDINLIIRKFYDLLKPGGILAIADLYSEDGSFHGPDVTDVHWGFDPETLQKQMGKTGFTGYDVKTCYVVKKSTGREYPIFLLTALKN